MRSFIILHSNDFSGINPLCRISGVVVTANKDVLRSLAEGNGPLKTLIIYGYSGWGPGQLESELSRKVWSVILADKNLIFDHQLDALWKRAREEQEIDLEIQN